MRTHRLLLPLDPLSISEMKIGDKILLSGIVYTARDQAHGRLVALIKEGKECPIPLRETAIFYCGPSPTPFGKICGAIGPTTSSRMDVFTPVLLDAGLKIMIGKGDRSVECLTSIKEHGAVYLTAIGGVSAVLNQCIVSCETFLWDDLGAEAVYRMQVKDFPCYVNWV